jgi:hypothetical protein
VATAGTTRDEGGTADGSDEEGADPQGDEGDDQDDQDDHADDADEAPPREPAKETKGAGSRGPKGRGRRRGRGADGPVMDANIPSPDGPRVSTAGGLYFVAVILGLIVVAIVAQFFMGE